MQPTLLRSWSFGESLRLVFADLKTLLIMAISILPTMIKTVPRCHMYTSSNCPSRRPVIDSGSFRCHYIFLLQISTKHRLNTFQINLFCGDGNCSFHCFSYYTEGNECLSRFRIAVFELLKHAGISIKTAY